MQVACAVVFQAWPLQPEVQEQELEKFMQSSKLVQSVHLKFFEIAPAGQELFKQSKTRMHALDMFELGGMMWDASGHGMLWKNVKDA